ncbi:MAG TPA: DUF488 domain-containing protein [Terracidiphilus sp.]|nr:DUF488 domain-containing protein [Terracidiphilus sp.]
MPQANRLSLPSLPVKQQVENKEHWNGARSLKEANFFTLGYTGRTTPEIIAALLASEVRTLVDIRQNAISMYRPELSKGNLAKLLASHGLNYVHFPQLGVPRDIRAKAIESGTRDVIWDWYDEHVIDEFFGTGRNLHFFLNCVEHPVALMCTEIDPQECHRHRLSVALERMGMSGFDL